MNVNDTDNFWQVLGTNIFYRAANIVTKMLLLRAAIIVTTMYLRQFSLEMKMKTMVDFLL